MYNRKPTRPCSAVYFQHLLVKQIVFISVQTLISTRCKQADDWSAGGEMGEYGIVEV